MVTENTDIVVGNNGLMKELDAFKSRSVHLSPAAAFNGRQLGDSKRASNDGSVVEYKEQHQNQPYTSINYDPEPHVIRKQAVGHIVYKQQVAVRYLKPPTPPPPGPLIIKEIRDSQPPPAPPVIIRQRPPRPSTPPPLIIRELPPQPPQNHGPKVITRTLPAPPPQPRRVIIERLPSLPPKPRSIIVERWLPYKQQKRRVVYQRAPQPQNSSPQKNLIIQWEGAQVQVLKEFKNLGITRADPNTYIQQYGPNLKPTSALPDFALNPRFDTPSQADETHEEFDQLFKEDQVGGHLATAVDTGAGCYYSEGFGDFDTVRDAIDINSTSNVIDSSTLFSVDDFANQHASRSTSIIDRFDDVSEYRDCVTDGFTEPPQQHESGDARHFGISIHRRQGSPHFVTVPCGTPVTSTSSLIKQTISPVHMLKRGGNLGIGEHHKAK